MNQCEQRGGRIEPAAAQNVDTDRARQLQPTGRGGQL
jgi:hypothetical protein